MKALVVERAGAGIAEAELREVEEPEAGRNQVKIEVKASALNPADWKIAEAAFGARFIHARTRPLRLGYDFSGVIVEIGEGVADLAEGDAVFGFLPYSPRSASGSLAERLVASADQIAIKPPGLSHADAAASATTGCTALQGLLDQAGLAAGHKVLVHGGSGGVGSYAVAIARKLGAEEVVATSSPAKAAFVEKMGAGRVVDYRTTPIESLGGDFDVVFDAAAASSYWACRSILAPLGHYVVTLPSPGFVRDKLASLLSGRSAHLVMVASRPRDLDQLAGWLAGGMPSPVTETVEWDAGALGDALGRLRDGEVAGKLAVAME